jgi:hypothetical protein
MAGYRKSGAHIGTDKMFSCVDVYRRKGKINNSGIVRTLMNIYWSIAISAVLICY